LTSNDQRFTHKEDDIARCEECAVRTAHSMTINTKKKEQDLMVDER
jgi:hypothetical protein